MGWFDLEWFADGVVMMMVVGSERERETVKKIIKNKKNEYFKIGRASCRERV